MGRKSLILAMAVLIVIFMALGGAVAFLYSDTETIGRERRISLDDACSCLIAVPSDAALVACGSAAEDICSGMLSSFDIPDSLAHSIASGALTSLQKCPMAVSLHYSGKLIPLYVFDVDDLSETAETLLEERLSDLGCFTLKNKHFLLASVSETLVKSSSRHIDSGVSVVDAPGFAEAIRRMDGRELIFVPHMHVRKLLSSVGGSKLKRHIPFLEHMADLTAFAVYNDEEKPISLKGTFLYDGDTDEYLTSLDKCTMARSCVADVLPSYTKSFVSISVSSAEDYMSAYKSYMDSRQQLHSMLAVQKKLETSAGIAPEELFSILDVQEVASASFMVGGKEEKINLLRIANKEAVIFFKGNGISSFRGYKPAVHSWAYQEFISSVFGSMFALSDESCFTYADGWASTASRTAIEDYVDRKALDYTLKQYLADAGKPELLSQEPVLAIAYYSLNEGRNDAFLKKPLMNIVDEAMGADCAPVVLTVTKDKKRLEVSADVYALTLKKTKAPLFDRDTTVTVPSGPFKVRNSHTGKMNTFYQNPSKAICLRDENGKDMWGVPFGKKLCGTAHNVDIFANGKLQILFGAGSEIYVIDRLGRYVRDFPVNLGKEILWGPDVYDFSGSKRYNIMVLHKDNTIDMYNLKGRKPADWKGITAQETIKALPQRLTLSGKDFWIVRTSIQTLIFPFYGGDPLTVFEGNDKIRPDSEVKPIDGTSVEVSCYNGKRVTLKLK